MSTAPGHLDGLSALARARAAVERQALRAFIGSRWIRDRLAASRREPVDGRTLDPDLAAMLGLDDLSHTSDLRPLSPQQARARVAGSVLAVDAPAPTGVSHEDRSIPAPGGSIGVRLYSPEGLAPSSPGIVYIHGGGWVTGSVATHDVLCRRFAIGAGARVVSIEYRLAPEHRFPAALDDALAATRWVLAHAEELGIDPKRVAAAGDSAGGNLSALVALKTERDARSLALQVLLYPALDGTLTHPSYTTFAERYFLTRPMCEWYYAHYLGGHDARDPDVSPLRAPEPSRTPALIYTAGFDPLRDEGQAYAERLRGAGTRVAYTELTSLTHGFILMNGASPTARTATEQIFADTARALGSAG